MEYNKKLIELKNNLESSDIIINSNNNNLDIFY